MSTNNSPQDNSYKSRLQQAIEKSGYYISYATEAGYEIPEDVLDTLVRSNNLINTESWDAEKESAFWKAYNKIAGQILPVTVESIEYANLRNEGTPEKPKVKPSKAKIAVLRYSIATVGVLVVLLSLQVYWYIGSDLVTSLQNNFTKRDSVHISVMEYKRIMGKSGMRISTDDPELAAKQESLSLANQQLDANYEILQSWNGWWQAFFGGKPYEGKITSYETKVYNTAIKDLEELDQTFVGKSDSLSKLQKGMIEEDKKQLSMSLELNKARNRLFLNMHSAQFTLSALGGYFLPLCYGLLGALLFVLRSLHQEIRETRYSRVSEIRFRLRVIMGALAGLAIGWFLNPSDSESISTAASPMAFSFLAGYNVDMLFSIMDKIIDSVKAQVSGGSDEDGSPKKEQSE